MSKKANKFLMVYDRAVAPESRGPACPTAV